MRKKQGEFSVLTHIQIQSIDWLGDGDTIPLRFD